jgi:hypothetical protein
MSDLPQSVWREIEKQSVYLPEQKTVGRFIGVGTLKTILKKSRRSNDQNALLWSLYEDILKLGGEPLAGFTKDELHEFFLIDYFGSETKELFGRKKLRPLKRSSRLTKMEFSDFVEHIVRKMAEQGIVLKLPGEQWPQ